MRKKQTIADVRRELKQWKESYDNAQCVHNYQMSLKEKEIAELRLELRAVQIERDANRRLAHALMQDNDTRCKAMDSLAETMRVAFLSSPVMRQRMHETGRAAGRARGHGFGIELPQVVDNGEEER